MTKQEYFDLLVTTSATGGFPALGTNGKCEYRCDNGKKCPIGLLISDDVYDPRMEGLNFSGLTKAFPGTKDYLCMVSGCCYDDLVMIQNAHDSLAHNGPWEHEEFVCVVRRVLFYV